MRQEIKYLGFGLLISLYSLKGGGGLFIPWEIQLAFGLLMMTYGSYVLIQNSEKKNALKYIIPVWGIFLLFGLLTFSNSRKIKILDSDLKEAISFQT